MNRRKEFRNGISPKRVIKQYFPFLMIKSGFETITLDNIPQQASPEPLEQAVPQQPPRRRSIEIKGTSNFQTP